MLFSENTKIRFQIFYYMVIFLAPALFGIFGIFFVEACFADQTLGEALYQRRSALLFAGIFLFWLAILLSIPFVFVRSERLKDNLDFSKSLAWPNLFRWLHLVVKNPLVKYLGYFLLCKATFIFSPFLFASASWEEIFAIKSFVDGKNLFRPEELALLLLIAVFINLLLIKLGFSEYLKRRATSTSEK